MLAIYLVALLVGATLTPAGVLVAGPQTAGAPASVFMPISGQTMTLGECDAAISALPDEERARAICIVPSWLQSQRDR